MKLNIKIVTVLLGIIIGVNAYSQDVNAYSQKRIIVKGGINNNDITFNTAGRVKTEYIGQSGNFLSVGLEIQINSRFGLYGGVSFLNKNYRFQRTGSIYGGQYSNYKTRYINVPFLLTFKPLEYVLKDSKFGFSVMAGSYLGYWTSLNIDGYYKLFVEQSDKLKYYKGKYDFDKNENNYSRLDYGLQTGANLSYDISKRVSILIDCTLLYGLSDNKKKTVRQASKYYYTTYNFGLGIAYKF